MATVTAVCATSVFQAVTRGFHVGRAIHICLLQTQSAAKCSFRVVYPNFFSRFLATVAILDLNAVAKKQVRKYAFSKNQCAQ